MILAKPLPRDTSSTLGEEHHAVSDIGRLHLPNHSGHEE
jgi:hypothetical protein